MPRRILIPIESEHDQEGLVESEKDDEELILGTAVAFFLWSVVFIFNSFNPLVFIYDQLVDDFNQSTLLLNLFALLGMFFTLIHLPWLELLEQICRVHLRILCEFPCAVAISITKCVVDILHSYWCVFAPNSSNLNSEYRFHEHPMERK